MSTLPAASYFSNAARTEGEFKTALEAFLAGVKEMPGGAAQSELTISSGAVTPTAALHTIDTEGDAASDDLDTLAVTSHPEGRLLVLSCANGSRVVTCKHGSGGSGQMLLAGDADVELDDADKHLILKRVGTDWCEVGRFGFDGAVYYGGAATLEATSTGAQLSSVNTVLNLNQGRIKLHEEAGGSDHTASGIVADMTIDTGITFSFGQVGVMQSNGAIGLADADAAATMPVMCMALETIASGASGSFLLHGYVRDDSWAWTVGGVVFASTTAGGLTQTAPSGTGDQVQAVGVATHADRMLFAPDKISGEVA